MARITVLRLLYLARDSEKWEEIQLHIFVRKNDGFSCWSLVTIIFQSIDRLSVVLTTNMKSQTDYNVNFSLFVIKMQTSETAIQRWLEKICLETLIKLLGYPLKVIDNPDLTPRMGAN